MSLEACPSEGSEIAHPVDENIDWKEKGETSAKAVGGLSPFYIAAHNYCTWQSQKQVDEDWKFSNTCQGLPTHP